MSGAGRTRVRLAARGSCRGQTLAPTKFYHSRECYAKTNEHNAWVPAVSWLEGWTRRPSSLRPEEAAGGLCRLTFMMLSAFGKLAHRSARMKTRRLRLQSGRPSTLPNQGLARKESGLCARI